MMIMKGRRAIKDW